MILCRVVYKELRLGITIFTLRLPGLILIYVYCVFHPFLLRGGSGDRILTLCLLYVYSPYVYHILTFEIQNQIRSGYGGGERICT